MALRFGAFRNQALRSIFRMAGSGGYAGSSGVTRKRCDAMLGRFFRMA